MGEEAGFKEDRGTDVDAGATLAAGEADECYAEVAWVSEKSLRDERGWGMRVLEGVCGLL